MAVRPVLRLPAPALKAVARPATVAVQGTTPEGATRLVEADAIEARALLHELDHLDGLLFLDRVVSASTDLFRRRRYR